MSEFLHLAWSNHKQALTNIIDDLHLKKLFCDATLACHGRYFPVHRLILSTCSEYFKEILEMTPGTNPLIILEDTEAEIVEALLDFIYLGKADVFSHRIPTLIQTASDLKIKGLLLVDEARPLKFRINEGGEAKYENLVGTKSLANLNLPLATKMKRFNRIPFFNESQVHGQPVLVSKRISEKIDFCNQKYEPTLNEDRIFRRNAEEITSLGSNECREIVGISNRNENCYPIEDSRPSAVDPLCSESSVRRGLNSELSQTSHSVNSRSKGIVFMEALPNVNEDQRVNSSLKRKEGLKNISASRRLRSNSRRTRTELFKGTTFKGKKSKRPNSKCGDYSRKKKMKIDKKLTTSLHEKGNEDSGTLGENDWPQTELEEEQQLQQALVLSEQLAKSTQRKDGMSEASPQPDEEITAKPKGPHSLAATSMDSSSLSQSETAPPVAEVTRALDQFTFAVSSASQDSKELQQQETAAPDIKVEEEEFVGESGECSYPKKSAQAFSPHWLKAFQIKVESSNVSHSQKGDGEDAPNVPVWALRQEDGPTDEDANAEAEEPESVAASQSCQVKYNIPVNTSTVLQDDYPVNKHNGHGKGMLLRCNHCRYTSRLKSALRNHVVIHSDEKPYKCLQCSYSTKYAGNLKSHARVHKREHAFKCNSCPYSTSRKNHLFNHTKIHTGEKPFKCQHCSFSAAYKLSLIAHLKTHIGTKMLDANVDLKVHPKMFNYM